MKGLARIGCPLFLLSQLTDLSPCSLRPWREVKRIYAICEFRQTEPASPIALRD